MPVYTFLVDIQYVTDLSFFLLMENFFLPFSM